jgi:hypothetical protein
MYFNSFNIEDISNVPGQNKTYYCQPNKWCDTQNSIQYFLNGQNVPTAINNEGLPLKNIMIVGPPTYSLVDASKNYQLNSFSVIFYLNFTSITLDTNAEIILYEMFAEYPNKIRISISEKADDPFNVVIGSATIIYHWPIPKSTILSNGNTTLYSVVYDYDTLKINLYIGAGLYTYSADVNESNTPTIILGVTPLQLNTNRNLDASILAFCYYNYALTLSDIKDVNAYFIQEASSTYLLESAYDALKASLLSQNNALIDKLNNSSQTINGLNSKIASMSCPAGQPSTHAPSGPRWHVKMNGSSSVNDSDLQQCSPLTLKEFDLTMPQLQIPNLQATAKKVTSVLNIPPAAASHTPSHTPSPAPALPTLPPLPMYSGSPAPALPTLPTLPMYSGSLAPALSTLPMYSGSPSRGPGPSPR